MTIQLIHVAVTSTSTVSFRLPIQGQGRRSSLASKNGRGYVTVYTVSKVGEQITVSSMYYEHVC